MSWVIIVLGIAILGTLGWASVSAAPWVPLWRRDVQRMIALAAISPQTVVYDLGAGDGRIVIAAAKAGAKQAIGLEIAILPYLVAWCKIWLSGVARNASMQFKNIYRCSFAQAGVVFIFLTPGAMAKLEAKLLDELPTGARVISYAFRFPNWQPATRNIVPGRATIYVYQK